MGETYTLSPDNATGQVVRTKLIELRPLPGGGLHFRCVRDGCAYHRTFTTLGGAKAGISQHALVVHRVRLFWQDAA